MKFSCKIKTQAHLNYMWRAGRRGVFPKLGTQQKGIKGSGVGGDAGSEHQGHSASANQQSCEREQGGGWASEYRL